MREAEATTWSTRMAMSFSISSCRFLPLRSVSIHCLAYSVGLCQCMLEFGAVNTSRFAADAGKVWKVLEHKVEIFKAPKS